MSLLSTLTATAATLAVRDQEMARAAYLVSPSQRTATLLDHRTAHAARAIAHMQELGRTAA